MAFGCHLFSTSVPFRDKEGRIHRRSLGYGVHSPAPELGTVTHFLILTGQDHSSISSETSSFLLLFLAITSSVFIHEPLQPRRGENGPGPLAPSPRPPAVRFGTPSWFCGIRVNQRHPELHSHSLVFISTTTRVPLNQRHTQNTQSTLNEPQNLL